MAAVGRALVVAGALGMSVVAATGARAAEIRVTWEASRVSLQAQDAPLADVLGALGGRAGFAVEGRPDPAARVTLRLDRVGLEEALRQLLRGVSHALVFDAPGEARGLAAVVLAGTSTRPGPSSGVAEPPAPVGPSASAPMPMEEGLRAAAVAIASAVEDPAGPPATVQELLAIRALAGTPAQGVASPPGATPAAGAPAGRAGTPAPAAPSASDESLAALTRQAQAQLRALVQGLATATSSLGTTTSSPATGTSPAAR